MLPSGHLIMLYFSFLFVRYEVTAFHFNNKMKPVNQLLFHFRHLRCCEVNECGPTALQSFLSFNS